MPKHRADLDRPPRRHGASTAMVALVVCAAATTGLVSTSGIVVGSQGAGAVALPEPASLSRTADGDRTALLEASTRQTRLAAAALVGRRDAAVSRSQRRTAVDPVKKALLDQDQGGQMTATEDLTRRDPRTIARAMLPAFGFDSSQFSCLDSLYLSESGWNVHADNPTSSAYGIPQALPGSKMASAGADWEDSAATQIRWGLGYIKARYGTPCSAWGFKQGNNWY